jgi:3-methyladenine DNA glycosylase AlkD
MRHTSLPESRRSLPKSDLNACHEDFRPKPLNDLSLRRSLKEELQSLDEVGPSFFHRCSLARDVELRAEGDIAILLTLDDRGHALAALHFPNYGRFEKSSKTSGRRGRETFDSPRHPKPPDNLPFYRNHSQQRAAGAGTLPRMTLQEAMAQLESLGDEQRRKINAKQGAVGNQFGVKMGDIRVLAKHIKTDPALAKELWQTGNLEARLLATLIVKPKELSAEDLDRMIREVEYSPEHDYSQLGDWLVSYVIKLHPDKERLRERWMQDEHPMAARAGWSLTAERVAKAPEGLDMEALLGRIEAELKDAPAPTRWTMNFCLAEIGIRHPEHRARAIEIGEKLGVYRDFPTPKGCTSPFAPTWIAAMTKSGDQPSES